MEAEDIVDEFDGSFRAEILEGEGFFLEVLDILFLQKVVIVFQEFVELVDIGILLLLGHIYFIYYQTHLCPICWLLFSQAGK